MPEYSHEDFAIGDIADVIDPSVAPDKPRVRILRHKYNLFQPWDCEIELGDPHERIEEKLKASFSTTGFVDGKFNGAGRFSGYSIEDMTIEDAKIKNLSADKIKANTVLVNVWMAVGSGNNIFKVDNQGIYLGHANFANAPFSVDMQGRLYATEAYIEGTIASSNIIGGTITGGTITGGNITSNTTINVTTNATIGNNLYLGNTLTSGKAIIFNSNASISNPSGTENLTVSAFGYLNLEGGYGVRINGRPAATENYVDSAIAAHVAAYH